MMKVWPNPLRYRGTDHLPKHAAWAGHDMANDPLCQRLEGTFGFALGIFPKAEQRVGERLRCVFGVDLYVRLPQVARLYDGGSSGPHAIRAYRWTGRRPGHWRFTPPAIRLDVRGRNP